MFSYWVHFALASTATIPCTRRPFFWKSSFANLTFRCQFSVLRRCCKSTLSQQNANLNNITSTAVVEIQTLSMGLLEINCSSFLCLKVFSTFIGDCCLPITLTLKRGFALGYLASLAYAVPGMVKLHGDFAVETIPTKPIEGQKPGTSGLRKKTKIFMEGTQQGSIL